MSPNRHLWLAGSSANAAEMTQMRRIARLLPPPCKFVTSRKFQDTSSESIGGSGGGIGLP
ncbi:MAG: hypothetical protein H0X30_05150 [Anaerolineae bacterium]|nr:hypothetical protein [Anaerolineae bacterium]